MTPPKRLVDDGPGAIRELLRSAPPTPGITRDQQARSRARVRRAAIGVAAGAGSLAVLQGAAIGAGLGLIGGAAIWLAPTPTTAYVKPPVVEVAPPRREAPAPLRVVAPPEVRPAVSASPLPALTPPTAPAAPVEDAGAGRDSLAEEAALLERARAALATSPSEALALTQTHQSRFTAGKLAMERELLAVEALRRLGRRSEARTRAEALLERAHGGLYEERLQKLVRDLQ